MSKIKINKNLSTLVSSLARKEEDLIDKLELDKFLTICAEDRKRIIDFAEMFYFIRADFCCINFVIGERCHTNERLWSGLAKNLIEELGGKGGKSHNQLYRDFLSCVGAKPEEELECPQFAAEFNSSWRNFAKKAPLMEALSAIAIYEIFDVPDYKLFLDVLERAGVAEKGLHFFKVHANAHHFEMFEDTITWLMEQEGGEAAFANATEFVFDTQRKMWEGLIECLEAKHTLTLTT
jgi:pyrroloquinoline quinone (PQQ) biosynthesis protein C